MSVSTHVVGYRAADELWMKHKTVWEACIAAGVQIPLATLTFFGSVYPGDTPGMEINIDDAIKEYKSDSCEGYEVDIEELPANVKIIRFLNCF